MFLLIVLLELMIYDVIIFNFGLYDINLDGWWLEEYIILIDYVKNLEEIKLILFLMGVKVGYVFIMLVLYNEI